MSYKNLINKAKLTSYTQISDDRFLVARHPKQVLKEIINMCYDNLIHKISEKIEVTEEQNEIKLVRQFSMTTYVFTQTEINELLETYFQERIKDPVFIEAEREKKCKLLEYSPFRN